MGAGAQMAYRGARREIERDAAMLRRLLVATGVAAILVAVGYGAASAIVYDKLSRVPGGCPAGFAGNTPAAFSMPGDVRFDPRPYWMDTPHDVRFPSRDPRITVSGWWLPAADARAPAIVVVHGLRACKRDYTVLLPAGMLARNGYSILLLDLRDHGDTSREDGRQAGGAAEAQEVLGAWDWLRDVQRLPADRIGVAGLSFGAAVSLIAAGQEHGIAAIWADSSYVDVATIMHDRLHQDAVPAFLDAGARFTARVLSGHDLDAHGALDAVGRLEGQALYLTHGGADAIIPARHSELLGLAAAAAGAPGPRWIVPGAGHTAAEYTDAVEYERRMVDFFGASLRAAP